MNTVTSRAIDRVRKGDTLLSIAASPEFALANFKDVLDVIEDDAGGDEDLHRTSLGLSKEEYTAFLEDQAVFGAVLQARIRAHSLVSFCRTARKYGFAIVAFLPDQITEYLESETSKSPLGWPLSEGPDQSQWAIDLNRTVYEDLISNARTLFSWAELEGAQEEFFPYLIKRPNRCTEEERQALREWSSNPENRKT